MRRLRKTRLSEHFRGWLTIDRERPGAEPHSYSEIPKYTAVSSIERGKSGFCGNRAQSDGLSKEARVKVVIDFVTAVKAIWQNGITQQTIH
jgi:hypothetical protein